MIYKYGNATSDQVAYVKKKIRKNIFHLLLMVDPEHENEFENQSVNAAFSNLLHKLGGFNSVLLEPPELLEAIALLEAALIEYNSDSFTNKDFRHCTYRKLLLDAGASIDKIKEV